MLSLRHSDFTGELRLYIATRRGEAWIARTLRRSPEETLDWNIWVRTHKGDVGRSAKSPLKLEVESHLRAWLLQRYKRCLRTLSFQELCAIAEREVQAQ